MSQPFALFGSSWIVFPMIWTDALSSWVRSTLIDMPLTLLRSNVQLLTPDSAVASCVVSMFWSAAFGWYGIVGPAVAEYVPSDTPAAAVFPDAVKSIGQSPPLLPP